MILWLLTFLDAYDFGRFALLYMWVDGYGRVICRTTVSVSHQYLNRDMLVAMGFPVATSSNTWSATCKHIKEKYAQFSSGEYLWYTTGGGGTDKYFLWVTYQWLARCTIPSANRTPMGFDRQSHLQVHNLKLSQHLWRAKIPIISIWTRYKQLKYEKFRWKYISEWRDLTTEIIEVLW